MCVEKTMTSVSAPEQVKTETRYYVASIDDIQLCASAIRGHWFSEIGHWYLDCCFDEDENSTMDTNAFENLSLIFKMVLSLLMLLRVTPHFKGCSINSIRKMFGWNMAECSKHLLSIIDSKTMETALNGEKLSSTEKKKIDTMLLEMHNSPIA